MLSLIHNILACDVMRPEMHVNAYEQCKNRKKFIPTTHVQIILYALMVTSHCKPKYCEPAFKLALHVRAMQE